MHEEYIKNSSIRALSENREKLLHGKNVFISDSLPDNIDVDHVLATVENHIPPHLLKMIEVMYVGQFPFLKERDINAAYIDGALYISNEQDDEQDMLDDVVHEIAHSVEELYYNEIYSDKTIEEEFLGKRNRMCKMLMSDGYKVSNNLCNETEYNKIFDEFLYKVVGYEKLVGTTIGLFNSPYGATSLKEYFANGFEAYFIGDRLNIKKISPYLYNKIEELENLNYF